MPDKPLDQPYKGLKAYEEADREIFYGRATQTELIIDHLKAFRLTIVYGGSGVGKSSILRAGVAARLRQQAQRNLEKYQAPRIAVVVFPPVNQSWKDDLDIRLKKQIEADIKAIAPDVQAPDPELSFIEMLEEWTKRIGKGEDDGKLFIILDQFEGFFLTYSQPQEAKIYADMFARAINRFGLRVNFLFSIRTNAFTQLDRFKSLIPNLMDKRIELKRLDRQSAEEAIRRPLEIYNQQHQKKSIEIEDELVKEVLDQVTVSQASEIEAPYLQLVMKRLWDKEMEAHSPTLRWQTLIDFSPTKGDGEKAARQIVREHFKQQLLELEIKGLNRQVASSLFKYLVTPSGAQIAQKVDDLTAYVNNDDYTAGRQEGLVKEWLEVLSYESSRILRACEGDRYEIYFDVLAVVVSEWLRTRSQIRRLAQNADKAWQDFDFSQRQALETAIKAGDALQKIPNEDSDWLKDSATIPIRRTLQVILENIREQRLFEHPNSPIYGASISHDGRLLATASFDGTIRLWNLEKSQKEAINEFQDPSKSVFQVIFSPDGQQLATACWDGTVRLWDWQGNQSFANPLGKSEDPAIAAISFSPDGQQLATASSDGTVRLWNLQESPSELQHIKPVVSTPFIHSLSFVNQGKQLAIAYWDGAVYLWDWQGNKLLQLGKPQPQLEVPQPQSGECQSQLLATASHNGVVRLWNLANPCQKPIEEFKAHNAPICYTSYDASRDELDTVSWDGKVRRWQLKDKSWREFSCNRSPVYRASFSSDGKQLVTVASDGAAHLWSLTDDYSARLGSNKLVVCQAEQAQFFCVSFSCDGKLATASADKTVRLWNSKGEQIAKPFESKENPVYRVSFSPDGRYLGIALGDPKGTACLVDLGDKQDEKYKVIEYEAHEKTVYCVSFNSKSNRIASASEDGTVHLWDLQGNPLRDPLLPPQKGTIYYVSFSPTDDQKLAMASVNGTIYLWDLQSNKKVQCIGHASVVYCLSFSPDGKLLASASGDGTVRLWDLEGKQHEVPLRHESMVYWVSFSHDGELLATACGDGKTCLWQVNDRQKIAEFKHHEGQVFSVCFSPDGQQVATASADGTVKLRRIENLEELLNRGRDWLKQS